MIKKIDPIKEEIVEQEPRKGLKYKVIDGDGPTRDPIWLANLKEFTIFVCREKRKFDPTIGRYTDKTVDLREYHVLNKFKVTTKLKMIIPGGNPVDLIVDTSAFSLAMDLVEVLYDSSN